MYGFPSGPQPDNRASFLQEKETGPEKQTGEARKKCPLFPERPGACFLPARKENAIRKENIPQKANPPYRPVPQRPQAAFPPLAAFPSRLRPGNRASFLQERKTGPEKQTGEARKNKYVFVFSVLPSDGKLTIKFTCPKAVVLNLHGFEAYKAST